MAMLFRKQISRPENKLGKLKSYFAMLHLHLNPAQIELSRKQFGVEMNILTRYCYKNIIGLVGFSSDGPELCLIYEFMPNGALSHRLDCRVRIK